MTKEDVFMKEQELCLYFPELVLGHHFGRIIIITPRSNIMGFLWDIRNLYRETACHTLNNWAISMSIQEYFHSATEDNKCIANIHLFINNPNSRELDRVNTNFSKKKKNNPEISITC